jgi:hypothetical protein
MKQLLYFFLPLSLVAVPAQVILMRNAETSPESGALTLKGRERAIALDPFFQGNPSVLFYGLPAAIFSDESSKETVAHLSNVINVPVSEDFSNAKELAEHLLSNTDFEGKMVLVCWPEEQLPALAAKLGVKKAPKKWSKDSFDRLWTISFEENKKIVFNDLPQKLLYGDSGK